MTEERVLWAEAQTHASNLVHVVNVHQVLQRPRLELDGCRVFLGLDRIMLVRHGKPSAA